MFQRLLHYDDVLTIAHTHWKHGDRDQAITTLCDAIRSKECQDCASSQLLEVSPTTVDHRWRLGQYYQLIGRNSTTLPSKENAYRRAIEQYGIVAQIDPMMIPRQEGRIIAAWPETVWALRGYIELLKAPDELLQRDNTTPYSSWRAVARHRFPDTEGFGLGGPDFLVDRICCLLRKMGKEAKAALPALNHAMRRIKEAGTAFLPQSHIESLIRSAIESLSSADSDDPNFTDSDDLVGDDDLIAQMIDPDSEARAEAARQLGARKTTKQSIIEGLPRLSKNRNQDPRAAAYSALPAR